MIELDNLFGLESVLREFFPLFPKFGDTWRYVSIGGGVLSLFVKFSRRRSKKNKFVKFPIVGEKNQENVDDLKIAGAK